MQKYFFLAIVIAVFIFGGIFFFFNEDRDKQNRGKEPENSRQSVEGGVAPVATVQVEGTVASLETSDEGASCPNAEGLCPNDSIVLKIDSIKHIRGPAGVVDVFPGEERVFYMMYSARPAKLIMDIQPTCPDAMVLRARNCYPPGAQEPYGPEVATAAPAYEEQGVVLESGYLVYHLPDFTDTDELTFKVLPGLTQGARVRIILSQLDVLNGYIVGEYQIIE